MAKNFRISQGAAGITPNMPHDARGNVIYTPEQVQAINREQNRRRISGPEMEAMKALVTAGNVIIQVAPVLFDHADHIGKKSQFKRQVTQMRKLFTALNMAVEVRQMGAICAQMANACITVSDERVTGHVNIRNDDMMEICNRAMQQCDMLCTCTREESKTCKLRRALELVPGVKEQGKEYARKDPTRCPYLPDITCENEMKNDAFYLLKQLEAERDAAVKDLTLYAMCAACKYGEEERDGKCPYKDDCMYASEGHFEWRGVQKEE